MKYNFPNKIKTNSFKDDVYSLGLTLLLVLTGDKIYNKNVYRYLLKICSQKIIVDLIDMMLTDE